MVADQLGHSRVSMTQDVYLGRESRVAAALEGVEVDGVRRKCGGICGAGDGRDGVRLCLALVRELARGLEPLTCCL